MENQENDKKKLLKTRPRGTKVKEYESDRTDICRTACQHWRIFRVSSTLGFYTFQPSTIIVFYNTRMVKLLCQQWC